MFLQSQELLLCSQQQSGSRVAVEQEQHRNQPESTMHPRILKKVYPPGPSVSINFGSQASTSNARPQNTVSPSVTIQFVTAPNNNSPRGSQQPNLKGIVLSKPKENENMLSCNGHLPSTSQQFHAANDMKNNEQKQFLSSNKSVTATLIRHPLSRTEGTVIVNAVSNQSSRVSQQSNQKIDDRSKLMNEQIPACNGHLQPAFARFDDATAMQNHEQNQFLSSKSVPVTATLIRHTLCRTDGHNTVIVNAVSNQSSGGSQQYNNQIDYRSKLMNEQIPACNGNLQPAFVRFDDATAMQNHEQNQFLSSSKSVPVTATLIRYPLSRTEGHNTLIVNAVSNHSSGGSQQSNQQLDDRSKLMNEQIPACDSHLQPAFARFDDARAMQNHEENQFLSSSKSVPVTAILFRPPLPRTVGHNITIVNAVSNNLPRGSQQSNRQMDGLSKPKKNKQMPASNGNLQSTFVQFHAANGVENHEEKLLSTQPVPVTPTLIRHPLPTSEGHNTTIVNAANYNSPPGSQQPNHKVIVLSKPKENEKVPSCNGHLPSSMPQQFHATNGIKNNEPKQFLSSNKSVPVTATLFRPPLPSTVGHNTTIVNAVSNHTPRDSQQSNHQMVGLSKPKENKEMPASNGHLQSTIAQFHTANGIKNHEEKQLSSNKAVPVTPTLMRHPLRRTESSQQWNHQIDGFLKPKENEQMPAYNVHLPSTSQQFHATNGMKNNEPKQFLSSNKAVPVTPTLIRHPLPRTENHNIAIGCCVNNHARRYSQESNHQMDGLSKTKENERMAACNGNLQSTIAQFHAASGIKNHEEKQLSSNKAVRVTPTLIRHPLRRTESHNTTIVNAGSNHSPRGSQQCNHQIDGLLKPKENEQMPACNVHLPSTSQPLYPANGVNNNKQKQLLSSNKSVSVTSTLICPPLPISESHNTLASAQNLNESNTGTQHHLRDRDSVAISQVHSHLVPENNQVGQSQSLNPSNSSRNLPVPTLQSDVSCSYRGSEKFLTNNDSFLRGGQLLPNLSYVSEGNMPENANNSTTFSTNVNGFSHKFPQPSMSSSSNQMPDLEVGTSSTSTSSKIKCSEINNCENKSTRKYPDREKSSNPEEEHTIKCTSGLHSGSDFKAYRERPKMAVSKHVSVAKNSVLFINPSNSEKRNRRLATDWFQRPRAHIHPETSRHNQGFSQTNVHSSSNSGENVAHDRSQSIVKSNDSLVSSEISHSSKYSKNHISQPLQNSCSSRSNDSLASKERGLHAINELPGKSNDQSGLSRIEQCAMTCNKISNNCNKLDMCGTSEVISRKSNDQQFFAACSSLCSNSELIVGRGTQNFEKSATGLKSLKTPTTMSGSDQSRERPVSQNSVSVKCKDRKSVWRKGDTNTFKNTSINYISEPHATSEYDPNLISSSHDTVNRLGSKHRSPHFNHGSVDEELLKQASETRKDVAEAAKLKEKLKRPKHRRKMENCVPVLNNTVENVKPLREEQQSNRVSIVSPQTSLQKLEICSARKHNGLVKSRVEHQTKKSKKSSLEVVHSNTDKFADTSYAQKERLTSATVNKCNKAVENVKKVRSPKIPGKGQKMVSSTKKCKRENGVRMTKMSKKNPHHVIYYVGKIALKIPILKLKRLDEATIEAYKKRGNKEDPDMQTEIINGSKRRKISQPKRRDVSQQYTTSDAASVERGVCTTENKQLGSTCCNNLDNHADKEGGNTKDERMGESFNRRSQVLRKMMFRVARKEKPDLMESSSKTVGLTNGDKEKEESGLANKKLDNLERKQPDSSTTSSDRLDVNDPGSNSLKNADGSDIIKPNGSSETVEDSNQIVGSSAESKTKRGQKRCDVCWHNVENVVDHIIKSHAEIFM